MTIISGNRAETLNPELFGNDISKVIALSIVAGNSNISDANTKIVNILAPNIKDIIRVDGQRIPIETHNVYFTQGSYSTEVSEFGHKISSFQLKEGEGYNAKVFKHEMEEVLGAKNNGINLVEKDMRDIQKYSRVYTRIMKPNKRLLALLTGQSEVTVIPKEKNKTDKYESDWGALRGEDNTDFLNPIKVQYKNWSHYRGLKDTELSTEDIFECSDLIKAYNNYSGDDIYALASPRTIYLLGSLYQDAKNLDSTLVDGEKVYNVAGVKFIEISNMSDDFILFYDSGCLDLILHAENKDENQRGLALITEKDLKAIETPYDMNGMKMRVFAEEFLVLRREALVILDIKNKGKSDLGKEGWMADKGATALETFCKQLKKSFANIRD